MDFNINSLIGDINQRLSKFKLVKHVVEKEDLILFLSRGMCPICGCRIYPTLDGEIWRCRSKKKDGFVIRSEVLRKFYDISKR